MRPSSSRCSLSPDRHIATRRWPVHIQSSTGRTTQYCLTIRISSLDTARLHLMIQGVGNSDPIYS